MSGLVTRERRIEFPYYIMIYLQRNVWIEVEQISKPIALPILLSRYRESVIVHQHLQL
jgi:hypothetical protein